MSKRKSHGAHRQRYVNPYSGRGFRDLPDGTPWSEYGSAPSAPPTLRLNPTTQQVLLLGATAAALGYILWKRPDLPGGFDDWVYEQLGHPPIGTLIDTGGDGTPGDAAAGTPGFSPITVEIIGHV